VVLDQKETQKQKVVDAKIKQIGSYLEPLNRSEGESVFILPDDSE